MKRKDGMGTEYIASHDRVAGKVSFRTLCILLLVWKPVLAQADPADQARRNASEGLQAALAELQQAAGPDQRVTARASILDAGIARPHLTGVWHSWEIDPNNNPPDPDHYSPGRETKFMKWLVSNQDAEATGSMDLPRFFSTDAAVLLGHGTLGPDVVDFRDIVEGGKVPATDDPDGSFAWVVLDEGVKARINTPFKDLGGGGFAAEAIMGLGSGMRPRTEFIDALWDVEKDWFVIGSPAFADLDRGLNGDDFMAEMDQLSPGVRSQLKRLTHEVGYHSMGLFCDVARGGLKKDFHLMTNGESLPGEIANQTVYASQLGLDGEVSDPHWQYFADFANLRADSIGGMPSLQADVPENYTPLSTVSGSPLDPNKVAMVGQSEAGTLHLPTIARIQFVFGVYAELIVPPLPVTRVDPLPNTHRLNMSYKPVVTLHNPYNVALKFDELKISFNNLPFAVQYIVKKGNGASTTTGLRAFDQISQSRFELTIRTASIGGGLQPGEVRVFDAHAGLQKDTVIGRKPIDMVPGFNPGNGNYLLERLALGNGYLDFKGSDLIGIQMAPRAYAPWSGNRFVVTMDLKDGRKAAVIEMDYKTPTGIEDAMAGNQNFPLLLDDVPATQLIGFSQLGEPQAIAEFGFRARTTSVGGVFDEETHPGKPWCFAHATSGIGRHRFDASHPADHSHEFGLRAINSLEEANVSVDPSGRGYFVSGSTPEFGVNFGVLHDIPLAPIQSFSTLNGADPTGVSGFLPRFAQPIGNSWAHPLIASDKLREPEPAGNSDYLDHSYLLNLALYDHFYFSGLADQTGEWFDDPMSTSELAEQFASGFTRSDPRLLFYRPNGQKSGDFVQLIEEDPEEDAYRRVSSWQMMKGAFNVNSTSVEAWKAMLASVHDSDAPFLDAEDMQINILRETFGDEARISRFRLPGSESFDDTGDRKAYWLGPREYSERELHELAERIVEQVRERGPFLSMGDFVNRRLTNQNIEHARCGALQQAIDQTEINRVLADDADAGGDIPFPAIVDNPYYKFPEAAEGASYQGAPGYLSQADLLTVLGNAATVRSDTFTIRAYGESRDESGDIIERAWCEAVVQRVPDWVDPVDAADLAPDQLTSETNQSLGRRFRLIAFRWLLPGEV